MRRMVRVGLAIGLVAGTAVAQNPPAAQPKAPQPQPKAQAGPPAAGQPAQMMMRRQMNPEARRAQLEQQIRNRIGAQLKNQLKLNDDQFAKLQATNKKFEEKRHLLVEQERDARMSMRDLMLAGDTTNQGKVSAALDRMLQIQRQRFDLVEQEQKEMAGYLTPMQRARFLGMQEQMRRRIEGLRGQAAGRGAGAGPMMPPGMGQGMGQGMGPGAGAPGAGFRPGQRPLRQQAPRVPPPEN